MARLTNEEKLAMKKDKGTLSIPEIVNKYGVSKATVHRILADKGTDRMETITEVSLPTTNFVDEDVALEFNEILTGKRSDDPPPIKEQEKENPVDSQASQRLAEHLFQQDTRLPDITEDITQMVEDPVERTAVLQRIMLNLDNFAPLFTFIHNREAFVQSLHSKSLEDLRGILKTMETTRTTINLANQMKQTFLMVGKATEVLGSRFLNLKTDGFVSGLLTQKQELDMIFRELAIDYAPKFTFQSRPEVRLAMLYGMTLLQTDNSNRIKDYIAQRTAEQTVEQPVEEKFADL
jgi:hypothetical protein